MLHLPPEFLRRVSIVETPVILLEGTRSLPPEKRPALTAFARDLALMLPNALFRTGNAAGTDDAFARGIEAVAPDRLEQFVPARGHRKATLHPSARVLSLDALPENVVDRVAEETSASSPKYAGLIKSRHVPKLGVKAGYLLRDTLKVHGDGEQFTPADIGIFYVNPDDPTGGGTGHTIAVCKKRGTVLVYTQFEWETWMQG